MGSSVLQRFFLLYCGLVSAAPATDIGDVTLYGPSYAKSLFEDLQTAFMLIYPSRMQYAVTTTSLDSHVTLGQSVVVDTVTELPAGIQVMPFVGFPLVMVFNLGNSSVSTIKFTQQVLVDVFMGRITHWNDTSLSAINPDILLPAEPITLVIGPLLDRFLEAMSVLAGELLNASSLSTNTVMNEAKVGAWVRSIPYTLGFTTLADAIFSTANVVLLQNKDGFFVHPNLGAASALSEFRAEYKRTTNVMPHNLPGSRTWPLMGMLYVILPEQMATCQQLQTLQQFLSLTMFDTKNMNLMLELLGWQPAEALYALDVVLGQISNELDVRQQLYEIQCGGKDDGSNILVGSSTDLSLNVLKLLAPYAGEVDPGVYLATFTSNMSALLDAMVLQDKAAVEVDAALTWEFALAAYPQLYSVPVFMGSVVPLVNLDLSPILSLPIVADIFLRVITYWNDPRIAALNPNMSLPNESIVVLAAPILGEQTILFAQLLSQASSNFSWSKVQLTVEKGSDIFELARFTPFSIGYAYGHVVENVTRVPRLIGSENTPVSFRAEALGACWISKTHPDCWPMVVPLSLAMRNPTGNIPCIRQKRSVDFVKWVGSRTLGLDPFLVPDPTDYHLGQAEFCGGRSLSVTLPERLQLSRSLELSVTILCVIGIIWATGQAIALALARKRSELKSASVVFSVLANVGLYCLAGAPLTFAKTTPSGNGCKTSVWLITFGFSLCYGSLFVKLLRLYVIFTSRKLVVPRLSNRKLLCILSSFMLIDFILLLSYSIASPPTPEYFSVFVPDEADLVTGHREITLKMCNFHGDSPALQMIIVFKSLIALGASIMSFFIRHVDRRFSSTTALGLAFYNLFLTSIIAVLISLVFNADDDLASSLFTPVFCGIWVVYVTLAALTLDSNVLLACKDFSKPLRKLLNGSSSKDKARETSKSRDVDGKKISDEHNSEQSVSGTVFVVNRDMFPSKYDDFNNVLLEQILEELNFQRAAVRRILALNSTGAATCIELSDVGDRNRGSTKDIAKSRPLSFALPTERSSSEPRTPSSNGLSATHSAPSSQISSDIISSIPAPLLKEVPAALSPS